MIQSVECAANDCKEDSMTHRERALAAMQGKPVDHIPFIARMDLWYEYHRNGGTLPERYRNMSLWDFQRDLGVGIFGFGAWGDSFFRLVHHKTEVTKETVEGATVTTYETPFGTFTCRDRMAEELKDAAGTGARIEYPFKNEKDYDALQFFFENTEVVDNREAYADYIADIGTDGLALPWTGHLPAHQLMIYIMGYQGFYFEAADNPVRLDTLVQALTEQQRQILELAADSPVQAIEVGGNYDEEMTPPPVFKKYFTPFYREARQILARGDKILVAHGDGEMSGLLECLRDCGIQVVEALTPKPMTTIDIAETRKLWADDIALWGGLASVNLTEAFSEEEFERSLEDLFKAVAPGDRFILGFGDNVPTDALFHRVQRVVSYWEEKGSYPLN